MRYNKNTSKRGGEKKTVQTVYGDLLFLINFSMDFLCLFLVAKLMCRPLGTLRTILGASLGGIYAVLSLFLPQGLLHILLDVVFCFLICAAAFAVRGESLLSLLSVSAAYIAASALLGGIMTAVFSLLNKLSPPEDIFREDTDIPPWILIPVGLLSGFATLVCGRFLKTRSARQTVHIEVRLGGKRICTSALCDSGHLLTEPLSGKPILLLDNSLASSLLPLGITPKELADTPDILAGRIHAIPILTANAESLLFALRPDRILVGEKKESHSADALIGFSDLGGLPCDCKALLPPELAA